MQPPHPYASRTADLDAAMSRVGMGSRWSPDRSPPPSWQPPYPSPHVARPATHPHPHSYHPYTPRLSPATSPSSLTDRDLSRRALAASGLDVSAPEFVPSFASRPAPPAPPAPEPEPETPLYDPPAAPHASFFHHRHQQQRQLQQLHAYYHEEPFPPPHDDAAYYPVSPPRPAHLDEATYVTAVQHFDEEFPALAKPERPAPVANGTVNAPTAHDQWSADHSSSPPQTAPAPEQLQAIFPKALGWDALQREEARKQRDADAARQWQAALDEYAGELEGEYDDLYDPEEPRLCNDVGALWVSTGQSVGHMYQSIRAEAAEEARLRNKYFDRAAAAFKRNDGASAKRLGSLGREANERMKELHRRAAEAIFEARNPPNVTDVVDLHGLHVSEALERLPTALEKAPPGILRILTGTGHHTKGTGRARLRPAVKKWLQDNGYFFEEVVDANEYVGSFKVDITR